jgi:uncharacterized membrane protein
MPSSAQKTGLATAAGVGLALGAAAFGAYVQTRKAKDRASDDAPGFAARRSFGDYEVSGRTVTIRRPRNELFAFWRDFQNLARVMENVEKIQPTGAEGRAVWTIKAPAGQTVEVETEIAREVEDELIAWRSVEGSDIATHGRVMFEDAPGERGTRVSLIVAYDPPAGKAGKALAKLLMREPAMQARHDLRRFKMLMETGEIATSARRRELVKEENA